MATRAEDPRPIAGDEKHGGVVQRKEHPAANREVAGPNPAAPTLFLFSADWVNIFYTSHS